MFVPIWLLILLLVVIGGVLAWLVLAAIDRNPLPFPDRGSRIFTASSPEGKAAMIDLLETHGIKERFKFDSGVVLRSVMFDGTIINLPSPEISEKLGSPSASIGLVSNDPEKSAKTAAAFFVSRGFEAKVVTDVEIDIPIAFVVTNAMKGTVINYRKHAIHLPRPRMKS